VIPAAEAMLAEALFCSDLQQSDDADRAEVCAAVTTALTRYGPDGCAALLAQAYGDHPETAQTRMAWALGTVTEAYALSRA
jgi:uncharacterized membrane protein